MIKTISFKKILEKSSSPDVLLFHKYNSLLEKFPPPKASFNKWAGFSQFRNKGIEPGDSIYLNDDKF